MKLSLLGKFPIGTITTLLLLLFSYQGSATSIELDSLLKTRATLAPLPIKTIEFVVSNQKEHLPEVGSSSSSDVSFSIANPSEDQISDWLAGDYKNLNQTFTGGGPILKASMIESAQVFIGKARSVIDSAIVRGNFVTQFTGKDLKSLPIAMKKKLGDNTEIVVGIGSIYLFPEYASLEIFVRVKTPKIEDPIFLAAPDVKFTRLGGISGNVSLGLLGDFTLPVLEEKATIRLRSAIVDEVKNEFKSGTGTYAEFSCDGLETISLDANLAISRDIILPADEDPTQPDTTNKVNANFFVSTSNGLSDIITELSFNQPFYHVKNNKLIWTIKSAVFDFSTLDHRNSLKFPVGNYDPRETLASKENWQGVYIKEISVEWRDSIAQIEGQAPKSFSLSGTNIIIDEAGFTGQITAENILPLSDNRQINKWAFSIDYLSVSILTNTFESLDFAGHLGMPMTYPDDAPPTDTTQLINYSGSFDFVEKRYLISGNLPTDKVLPLKMFKGQIRIENTSVFTVGYEDKKIFLGANLNADFETKSDDQGEDEKKLAVPLVEVTGLNISSKSPFLIATGNWILRDTISVASFGGFGLNINYLSVEKNNQTMNTELIVGADINLAAGDKVNISGATIVRVTANIEDTPTSQKWKFKEVNLEMIKVEADLEAFSISGQVVFFKNLESGSSNGQLGYGSGFQGSASLKIKGLNKKDDGGGSDFMAMALFGTSTNSENERFRYFMVDVLAYFSNGIPIGPIGLYGVGGGVYYRMEQEDLGSNFTSIPAFSPPSSEQVNSYTDYISSFLGESLSGTKYRPSESVLLGINLNVIIGSLPKPQAFNANIGFNMEFNTNGGLNFIKLEGIMNTMTDISPEGPACSGVSLAVEMEFVFKTSSERSRTGFYASAHAFVKVGPLSGSNGDNVPSDFENYIARCSEYDLGYAGGLEMQFSKDYWFLNVGEPERRLGLQINLWKLGSIKLETYFDIGKNIPAFPGLPPYVRSLTGMGNLMQNENTRAAGTGFAFGVSFDASLDTPSFLGFSAHVALGAGFDIMLNKFRDVNCLNSGSPKPIGVNNWYAAGQAWAYIDAGIKFKGIEILGVGLAAALQIKGPNPTFGRGALAGRVRLGPFKKKFNIHFKFGKECEFQGSQQLEQEIEIVLFMTPSNDDQAVEVTTPIDLVFAQELDKTFTNVNPNNGNNDRFKILMESFEITDSEGNQVVANQEQISGQFFRYLPVDQLKSNTEYTLTLNAVLLDSIGGLIEREERIHIFKTGELPTEIFDTNIDYAIPGNGQFNLYKFDESSQSIQLLQGQDELLDLPEGQSLKIKISSTHPTSISYKNCSYNASMNRLDFNFASGLANGKSYKFELVKVLDEEFPEFENSENFELDSLNLPIPFENESVLYTMAFRVSNYNRFEDKMEAMEFSSFLEPGSNYPKFLNIDYARPQKINVTNISEPFGVEEVDGIYGNDPSLIFDASINSTQWIVNNYRNFSGQEASNMDIYGNSLGERMIDYLDEDRVAYFGLKEPGKAIFILQDSLYQSKLENIFISNSNMDFSDLEIQIDYAIGRTINEELNAVFSTLKSSTPNSFDIFNMMGYFEFQNPSSDCGLLEISLAQLKNCCKSDDWVYDLLRDFTEDRLAVLPGTMRKFVYAPSNRINFCNWDYNMFTKRNLYTDLTPGSYPVTIKYYKPNSTAPHQSFNQTFIKNQ